MGHCATALPLGVTAVGVLHDLEMNAWMHQLVRECQLAVHPAQ